MNWATLIEIDRGFVGHEKAIKKAAIAQEAASVRSKVIPISALVEATNRARSRKEQLIVVSLLFVAAAVTTAWMIGLAWGAIALAQWLFS